MIDTDLLEEKVQDLIVDICKILYEYGYREVPVGAMMRLIGVDNEEASTHDNEFFRLDGEFEALIEEENDDDEQQYKDFSELVPPPGTVFH